MNTLRASDVHAAAERIAGRAVYTPLIESAALNDAVGARVFLKAECLQRAGSFKYRGALNALLCLGPATRARGVIAFSSGNHALAVATAAKALAVPAVVVMPDDAPGPKLQGARDAGAEVILYDRASADREAICAQLMAARGLALIRPYDDLQVMAGQGTVALEALHQARERGSEVDTVYVPCSGGGLAAGCAVLLAQEAPQSRVVVVEPAGFDDTSRSLRSRRREHNSARTGSMCDALLVTTPGELTLPLLIAHGAGGVTVSEEAVLRAMGFALRCLKLAVEPGGAVALAALMSGLRHTGDNAVIAILSGGNASTAALTAALATEPEIRGGFVHA